MGNVKKSLIVASLALSGLLPAPPAAAHIQTFAITNVVANPQAGEYQEIQGTITCTAGEGFLVTGKVTDSPSYVGKGRTKGACTGEQQSWVVTLTNESGVADFVCPQTIRAKAHTKLGGEPHDAASFTWVDCQP